MWQDVYWAEFKHVIPLDSPPTHWVSVVPVELVLTPVSPPPTAHRSLCAWVRVPMDVDAFAEKSRAAASCAVITPRNSTTANASRNETVVVLNVPVIRVVFISVSFGLMWLSIVPVR
jgi:hypothetical protein